MIKVRLFGGHADGKVVELPDRFRTEKFGVPVPPGRPPVQYWDVDDSMGQIEIHEYQHDGTVNEQGEYRFRFRSP